jgi:hypothetical protein
MKVGFQTLLSANIVEQWYGSHQFQLISLLTEGLIEPFLPGADTPPTTFPPLGLTIQVQQIVAKNPNWRLFMVNKRARGVSWNPMLQAMDWV